MSESALPGYADVVVPRHLYQAFTYAIPEPLRPRVHLGQVVRVPLGRSTVQGVVVAVSTEHPLHPSTQRARPPAIREILAVVDDDGGGVPLDLLELTRQVAEYYLSPWGQCLRLALPALTKSGKAPARRLPPDRSLPPPGFTPPSWWPRFQDALARQCSESFILEAPMPQRWAVLRAAVQAVLDRHRQALLISPEIRRAEALAALCSQLWPNRVALLHSGLPCTVRTREWQRILHGQADLVIGTRSAVFAPLTALTLIGVDEEDDPALKEEQEPHYHARDVAAMRARQHGAILVFGTAHASVDMWQMEATGLLAARIAPPAQAPVQVVDLRHTPRRTLLSEPLVAGVARAIRERTGAILFVNRKGFAPALSCRDCGNSPTCSRCSVALTLYRRAAQLVCRYCGAAQAVPDTCPACRSARLAPIGAGTEQLEDKLQRLFPTARIGRLDRDTARTFEQVEHLRKALAEHRLDILIGTQLLFQGLPFPPVGFVGIPFADASLHRPDFRAAEWTYHTLRDAITLARPDGQVVLQTTLPHHHTFVAVATNDPTRFYEPELTFRRALGYPPFSHLISLRVSGPSETVVREAATQWAAVLNRCGHDEADGLSILGPIPATVARIRGRYRWHILVKASNGDRARRCVKETLAQMEASTHRDIKFDVDVDPITFT